MKIGIDISQIAHEGTGVGKYIKSLVQSLINLDRKNEYILFFSSMRKKVPIFNKNVQIKSFRLPPVFLDLLWNRLHIFPIEWFIGNVDVFISSDWTQPPTTKAKKVTILYDLIVYKYPEETAQKIISVQRRRLQWVKKECGTILCISESTKKDAIEILGIAEDKLKVVYPGV